MKFSKTSLTDAVLIEHAAQRGLARLLRPHLLRPEFAEAGLVTGFAQGNHSYNRAARHACAACTSSSRRTAR